MKIPLTLCWFVASSLTLAIAGPAQTLVTSPPGFLSTLAGDDCHHFGAFSFGRYMILDGEYRKHAMALRGTDYRPLPNQPSSGRTFQSVTIRASECDFDKIDWARNATFTTVSTTTPTTVFQAAVTWPRTTWSSPRDWRVRFPFKTNWVYTGKKDICLDHVFFAGTLQGGSVPWWKQTSIPYFLDATPMEFSRSHTGSSYTGAKVCLDPALRNRPDVMLSVASFGPLYPTHPQLRNSTIATSVTITAPNTPILNMLSFVGSTTGVSTPLVQCQNLYLDLTKPTLYTFAKTPGGGWAYVNHRIPYDPRWGGMRLWLQSAWNDSKTNQLKLTPFSTVIVPQLPEFYRRGVIHHWDGSSATGVPSLESHFVPIARYIR